MKKFLFYMCLIIIFISSYFVSTKYIEYRYIKYDNKLYNQFYYLNSTLQTYYYNYNRYPQTINELIEYYEENYFDSIKIKYGYKLNLSTIYKDGEYALILYKNEINNLKKIGNISFYDFLTTQNCGYVFNVISTEKITNK